MSGPLTGLRQGVERRASILEFLEASPENRLLVNRRYCLIIKKDSDLKYLIKKGKLTMKREGCRMTRNSYLVASIHDKKGENVPNA